MEAWRNSVRQFQAADCGCEVRKMNEWNRIWGNRSSDIVISDDVFDMFCKLKKADGFDTQDVDGYYEAFFSQWKHMVEHITQNVGDISSVYEVGCGSGVNLYLFQQLKKVTQAGGCDYFQTQIALAKKILNANDLQCMEADQIAEEPVYDVILSDSVFQYFQSPEYGMRVVEKMWNKAKKMVVITEIHDEEMKEEHLNHRRQCVENYDEKYKGLDKTFYTKEMFLQFADRVGAKCELVKPQNDLYWNNKYVFDCYLTK